jgi:hypothetical protein
MQTVVVGIVGALVAALGVLIAYFQWRTAHQRIVLDLFDRRASVIEDIEKAATDMLNATTPEESGKSYWSFARAEPRARLLFGPDVAQALEALRADMATVDSTSELRAGAPKEAHDKRQAALKNIAAFIQTKSGPLFAPYVRLDQKLNIWWPL